jgi:hypothetical protein
MGTQISRDSHRHERHYSGVYQQQGRMITDADWNELVELVKRRLAGALGDGIASGAPRTGGVGLVADQGGGPVRIRAGRAYVDGIPAEVVGKGATSPGDRFGVDEQLDFPRAPVPPVDATVYLDVWEREVTSLEDAGLRDPALHGADTCTRTRTMAQIKWAPASIDPAVPRHNPTSGNAVLGLVLHTGVGVEDPCDPCAAEVAVEGRTGNYLFRLEVHDVLGAPGAQLGLTLKWSSENAGEQYPVTSVPPEFSVGGPWVFETYDDVAATHLGVHLADGFTPIRGALHERFPDMLPDAGYVRRWDGYCMLERADPAAPWQLAAPGGHVQGVDLGTRLGAAAGSHGHVDIGDALTIDLNALIMSLRLVDAVFVAGDHWLAPVREDLHDVDAAEPVAADLPPHGVRHHYLTLGRTSGGGLEELNSRALRRFAFPPLTDLTAPDVGYAPDCPSGLFRPADDTVAKALDRICEIGAEHVTFTQGCQTSIFQGAQVKTVAEALGLLCDVRADQIGYTADPACTALKDTKTVQAALDALCAQPHGGNGGGECITIGQGGDFDTLRAALDQLLPQHADICLCLLPGEHTNTGLLEAGQQVTDQRLRISGCGPATRLQLDHGSVSFLQMSSVELRDLTVTGGLAGTVLTFDGCTSATLTGVHISGSAGTIPVIVQSTDRFALRNSRLHALGQRDLNLLKEVIDKVDARFDPLVTAIEDDADEAAQSIATTLAVLTQPERVDLANRWKAVADAPPAGIDEEAKAAMRGMVDALTAPSTSVSGYSAVVSTVRRAVLEADTPIALSLRQGGTEATVEGNNLFGLISLYGEPRPGLLTTDQLIQLVPLFHKGELTTQSFDRTLRISGNTCSGLTIGSQVAQQLRTMAQGGNPKALTDLFGVLHIGDNVLNRPDNGVVGERLTLADNVFRHQTGDTGWFFGRTAVYTGNHGLHPVQQAVRNGRFFNGTTDSVVTPNLRIVI